MAFVLLDDDDDSRNLSDVDDDDEEFVDAVDTVKKIPRPFLLQGEVPSQRAQPQLALARVRRANCGAKKNLFAAMEDTSGSILLPEPSAKETVRVYLRVKPKTLEESELSLEGTQSSAENEDQRPAEEMVVLESDYQVAMNAPKESNAYKNSVNGVGKLTHRYVFTHIFPPEADQSNVFDAMVLPRVSDFLEGQNQLMFTYGASSSGKTYTIQGEPDKPGILPRALDVIFNSIGDKQTLQLDLMPNCFNRVVEMRDRDIRKLEQDKISVFDLGRELQAVKQQASAQKNPIGAKISGISLLEDTWNSMNVTNISADSMTSLFPELSQRSKDPTSIELKQHDIQYAIWISFAEIYNENVYDLLEKMPQPKRKGERAPRRCPLKLAEDNHGSIFIRGLKEIKVNSANEAYQVMMIGRENLHFAATRLNHHSSRSHCIFTIKAIRAADTAKPHLARISMLSFCDLAGSERIKKTLNTGERQKEAGNINTSLLVLGRCLKAIRHNQIAKDPRKHQIVPFRESKLTRMFQSFLIGHGKASMVVNISQAPYLFDESMNVLKFAAITSKITIEEFKKPEPVVSRKLKRQTRFSIMVERNQANSLMGRGSVGWDLPAARSTLCPSPSRVVQETYEDESTILEETFSDGRYDGFLKIIDNLKNQLIQEKQAKVKLETELRTELCAEFNKMMVEIEHDWEKRLKDQKNRCEEVSELRFRKLQEEMGSPKKRFRPNNPDDTVLFEKEELEFEVKNLQDQLGALKDLYDKVSEDRERANDELAKKGSELQMVAQRAHTLEDELKQAQEETEKAKKVRKEAEEMQSNAPIIADMTSEIEQLKQRAQKLELEKDGLKELLDEAGEDFVDKSEQVRRLEVRVRELETKAKEDQLQLDDLTSQVDEARLLLTDFAQRNEEMERQISEFDEQSHKAWDDNAQVNELKKANEELESCLVTAKQQTLEHVEEKSKYIQQISEMKETQLKQAKEFEDYFQEEIKNGREKIAQLEKSLSEAHEELDKLKEETIDREKLVRKADLDKDRMERELNDEIENEKEAKLKLRRQIEAHEKQLKGKTEEVYMLELEVKSLIQKLREQGEAAEEGEKIRKELIARGTEVETLKEKVNNQLEQLKVMSCQKHDLEKAQIKIESLQQDLAQYKAEVEVKNYDLTKLRADKDSLMGHYNSIIKKKSEELALEKRETSKIREAMYRVTPKKVRDSHESEEELKMLREELQKKTDLIKTLESMIPAQNESSSSDDANAESPRHMKRKLPKLTKELDHIKHTHEKEIAAVRKEYGNTILDFKLKDQASAHSVGISISDVCDDSILNETVDAKEKKTTKKSRTSRKQKRATTSTRVTRNTAKAVAGTPAQVSFEDSNGENDPVESDEDQTRKASTRLQRTRLVKMTKLPAVDDSDSAPEPQVGSPAKNLLHVLKDVNGTSKTPARMTPGMTPGKQKLYQESAAPEMFTPPPDTRSPAVTPLTAVKMQLRSRSTRKRRMQ